MDHSLQLYQYHLWANKTIFNHLKEIPETYSKEVNSVFSSVKEVLYHLYQVDYIWLRTISGDPFEDIAASIPQLKEENADNTIEEMEDAFVNLGEKYKAFINNQEDMNRHISIHHPKYGTLHTTYAELIQHVVNHGTYHRGNITAILRQLGHTGVPTDYVSYLFILNQS
ncbi:damage-inducible protein DinB [Bacillus sporothermodurans]|uniref:DinB family protein n=1 Tax=Heyndrickxia sporothermodurans TaxID=46224 RepID=UPI00192BB2A3|nr:DinB family protein [Heyndrickxia sporothermodurans]MBL5777790.1 damage-inducible protein DinB [Heyndrickxia sporothermodurans]